LNLNLIMESSTLPLLTQKQNLKSRKRQLDKPREDRTDSRERNVEELVKQRLEQLQLDPALQTQNQALGSNAYNPNSLIE